MIGRCGWRLQRKERVAWPSPKRGSRRRYLQAILPHLCLGQSIRSVALGSDRRSARHVGNWAASTPYCLLLMIWGPVILGGAIGSFAARSDSRPSCPKALQRVTVIRNDRLVLFGDRLFLNSDTVPLICVGMGHGI